MPLRVGSKRRGRERAAAHVCANLRKLAGNVLRIVAEAGKSRRCGHSKNTASNFDTGRTN
jgi:hypothetical protein